MELNNTRPRPRQHWLTTATITAIVVWFVWLIYVMATS